jgi:hypothetical protein
MRFELLMVLKFNFIRKLNNFLFWKKRKQDRRKTKTIFKT